MSAFLDWFKGLFVKKPILTPVPPPIENVSPVSLEPPHLTLAFKQVGRREGRDDAWIVSLFKTTDYHTNSSSTAWCAAFVCWLMKSCGLQNTRSAAALSQSKLGEPCPNDESGAVLVWHHLTGSLKGHYHTNVLIKKIDADTWYCIGGNQHNAVSCAEYGAPDYKLISSRRPVKA